jgi:glycosyltransferase involved in cell wall biosynthesis
MASVLFNDLVIFRERSGIGHYAALLLESLERVAPDLRVIRMSELKTVKPVLAAMASRSSGTTAKTSNGAGTLTDLAKFSLQSVLDFYLGQAVSYSGCDLFHEPDAIAPRTSVPTIATFHDLSVLLHPEWHPSYRVKKYRTFFMRSLQRLSHLIANSESTKQAIVHELNVESEKITAIVLAGRPQFRLLPSDRVSEVKNKFRIDRNYFLFIGNAEPRKNLLSLLKAYAALPTELRESYRLVLAGGAGWKSSPVMELAGSDALKGSVVRTGYLADEELVALTCGARALVYPSLDEGFGMPALEAMACGTPVLCSAVGGLREAAGQAAYWVDPHNLESIKEGLRALAQSDLLVASLREKGLRQAEQFNWDKVALETAAVYRRFLTQ